MQEVHQPTSSTMLNDGVDVIATIQSNAKAGRIAFVDGEHYDETLASIRLYDAAQAIANYLATLCVENVSAYVFSENRWEVIAFYLAVRLYGGSVKILDYTASEGLRQARHFISDKLYDDFRGCQVVLCAGKDVTKVHLYTVEKNVKYIVMPPARISFNAISMDQVLQIRINRGLSLHEVCHSDRTSRLIRSALQRSGLAWTPQNSLCAVIAPLHQGIHLDVAISCILLGIPVLLANVCSLDGFMRWTRSHGIDIVSIDEPTLLELHAKCETPSSTVTTVLFEGRLTTEVKEKLSNVFPQVRTIREVSDELMAKL